MNLIDIYRTLHPKIAEYTFFSTKHEMFSRIVHTQGHKTSLNKFKRTEITASIFSNLYDIKEETNYRNKNGKIRNTCRLNNILLKKKQWVNDENKEEIRKYLETLQNL